METDHPEARAAALGKQAITAEEVSLLAIGVTPKKFRQADYALALAGF